MSRDAAIENWLESMSKPELIDQFAERHDRIVALEAENAKLRELVKDIHTLATDYGVCVRYPYCDAWNEKLAVAEKQVRELVVKVD